MSLATFRSRIRALENFDLDVAKEAAPLVEKAARAQAEAGLAPDGSPWAPRKLGGRPLQNASGHLTAKANGGAVDLKLTGTAEVLHDQGAARGKVKRQILPSDGELPGYLTDAMHEGAKRAFEKRGGK